MRIDSSAARQPESYLGASKCRGAATPEGVSKTELKNLKRCIGCNAHKKTPLWSILRLANESGPGVLQARRFGAAICVQRFDDSLNPAIHITYRVSRRSSSLREPRDPSLKGGCWIGLLFVRKPLVDVGEKKSVCVCGHTIALLHGVYF